MTRGDVYWVRFEHASGGEIRKTRPAIIVSNDAANKVANRIQVVPLTSSVRRLQPWEAAVQVAGRSGKAVADRIQTVTKERVLDYVGAVTAGQMRAIESAIKRQLDLT